MKFVLLVEGHTERRALGGFLKRWLDPQLSQPVGMQIVRFDGWPQVVKDTPIKARMHLGRADVIGVIALLDLHGPTFYPPGLLDAAERVRWARNHLEGQVTDQRFRQFFAVHETEAWLLSDSGIYRPEVAQAVQKLCDAPEQVDFDEPPAKRLDAIYQVKLRRGYKKTVDGEDLFSRLDPRVAAAKCPYLQEMLGEMLRMAQAVGL